MNDLYEHLNSSPERRIYMDVRFDGMNWGLNTPTTQ